MSIPEFHRLVKTVTFEVPGAARGKQRARHMRLPNGAHRTYTPAGTVNAQQGVKFAFMAAAPRGWRPWEGPVDVTIRAYFLPPQSWPAWKRELLEAHGGLLYCQTPDADNIRKLVLDGLNGVAFRDDKQCFGSTVRYYGRRPRTEVVLRFLRGVPKRKSELVAAEVKEAYEALMEDQRP